GAARSCRCRSRTARRSSWAGGSGRPTGGTRAPAASRRAITTRRSCPRGRPSSTRGGRPRSGAGRRGSGSCRRPRTGRSRRAKAALPAEYADAVTGFVFPGLYLDHEKLGAKLEAAERTVAAALRGVPGVAYALAGEDLARGVAPPTDVGRAMALAFDAARSG